MLEGAGSRRNRRSYKRGPNWLLIVLCVIIVVALSIVAGNILGEYILGSGRVVKSFEPLTGLVTTNNLSVNKDTDGTKQTDDTNLIGSDRHTRFPSLILPPNAELSQRVDESSKDSGTTVKDGKVQSSEQPNEEKKDAVKTIISGSYQIQAGLYLKEENAKVQMGRLEQEGIKAQVVRVPKNGSYFYRVQVSGFGNKEAASVKAQELGKKGYSTFVIGE